MGKILLFFAIFLLAACEKPNPNPELSDAIYSDLTARAETANKSVEAERKKLEGFKKDLENAKPQSGDTKVAQKRYFETEKKIAEQTQQAHFLELHAETRKKYVRIAYTKGFNEKKPWDSEAQGAAYSLNRKLAQQPLSWDSANRIKAYQQETGLGGAAGTKKTEGAKPSEEKKE
jgi:hypothetical protein